MTADGRPLRDSLEDYLALRRALGFRLKTAGRLLDQFVSWLDDRGSDTITTEDALAWAVLPPGASQAWQSIRLSTVRGFAAYLHGTDPSVQVPPAGLIRRGNDRATPYLYSETEISAVSAAAGTLRPRFRAATYQTLISLLAASGCRAGEVLGFRHEDIAAAEQEVSVVPRENANGARAKSGGRRVPVGPELIRLYADYLHEEYGSIDSDYVFVNVWAEPKGQAWSYPAAYDLVLRLRARTGLDFDPHWFRHSAATRWLRDGVSIEVVSKLLGHSSVTTTSATYGHLTAEDARAALEKAGWLTGREVTW